ncbi:transcription factor, partial [Trichoderma arundinaceum]
CSNCRRDGQICEKRPRQRRAHVEKTKASSWQKSVQNNVSRTAEATVTSPVAGSDPTAAPEPSQICTAKTGQPTQGGASQMLQQGAQSTWEGDASQPPRPSPSPVSVSSISTGYESGYMERSAYIAPDKFRGQDGSEINYIVPLPSDITRKVAKLQKAFEIPPRAIRESLLEKFWTYCYSWDPIVDQSQLMGRAPENVSPLLLQSIFLAGSRMLSPSHPHVFCSPEDYYTRAKTLFWLDYENDPMTVLIAASLMYWWNPHGPERVSTNTSSFWCRITVSLAQQMGLHSSKKSVPDESLRRRLWWSIVARDCLISVAHGRPKAINLEECDIPRPTVEDFPTSTLVGLFFIAYIDLSLIMGQFTQHEIRKSTIEGPFPTAAVIAASTLAGIFEDFLARDEVRFLGPCFTFHLLAASIALLSCYKYSGLWKLAQEDLKTLAQSQEEMKKSWPSALGSIETFDRMYKLTMGTQKRVMGTAETTLTQNQANFFNDCDMSLCRMYTVLTQNPEGCDSRGSDDLHSRKSLPTANTAKELNEVILMTPPYYPDQRELVAHSSLLEQPPDSGEAMTFDQIFQGEAGRLNGAIGDWLFWDRLAFDVN